MKIKVWMTALLGIITISAFAQKGELSDAQNDYDKYSGLAGANMALAKPSLMTAKGHIDKASANQKTSALPQTYALKAAVYASLASIDTVKAASATEYATAQEALNKAKELDTKKENTKLIADAGLQLAKIQLNNGVTAYQNKKYDEAYKSFDAYRQLRPDDTTAMFYTALAAANSNNYSAAISNYTKLLTTNYSGKPVVYNDLASIYLANKDTANAIKTIDEAVAKYPNNTDLHNKEIMINLNAGQQKDMIAKIDAAIKNDPKNKDLYFYEGLTYSQIAEQASRSLAKLKSAAAKAAKAKPGVKQAPDPQIAKLNQEKEENFAKSAEAYKKAIALDPNSFETNLNLGYVIISPALDEYNDAQMINDKKTYDARMAKVKAQFDDAKPYLLKAVELNPKSGDALQNLKMYYLGKQDSENANATQKKIDALAKGN